MLRVTLIGIEYGHVCHVGGPPQSTLKSVDIDNPEIEQFLRRYTGEWSHAHCVGIEVREQEPPND